MARDIEATRLRINDPEYIKAATEQLAEMMSHGLTSFPEARKKVEARIEWEKTQKAKPYDPFSSFPPEAPGL